MAKTYFKEDSYGEVEGHTVNVAVWNPGEEIDDDDLLREKFTTVLKLSERRMRFFDISRVPHIIPGSASTYSAVFFGPFEEHESDQVVDKVREAIKQQMNRMARIVHVKLNATSSESATKEAQDRANVEGANVLSVTGTLFQQLYYGIVRLPEYHAVLEFPPNERLS